MFVDLHQVSKSYWAGTRQIEALSPTSLVISAGDAIWLHGRNGSGKTTLLEIISGHRIPDTGSVKHYIPRSQIALLSQTIPEYAGSNLTVAEHIGMGYAIAGRRSHKRIRPVPK